MKKTVAYLLIIPTFICLHINTASTASEQKTPPSAVHAGGILLTTGFQSCDRHPVPSKRPSPTPNNSPVNGYAPRIAAAPIAK